MQSCTLPLELQAAGASREAAGRKAAAEARQMAVAVTRETLTEVSRALVIGAAAEVGGWVAVSEVVGAAVVAAAALELAVATEAVVGAVEGSEVTTEVVARAVVGLAAVRVVVVMVMAAAVMAAVVSSMVVAVMGRVVVARVAEVATAAGVGTKLRNWASNARFGSLMILESRWTR